MWTSLGETNFHHFQELFDAPGRSEHGPFFGWLCTAIPIHEGTLGLKTVVHLRDAGGRPWAELEATDHSLAVEQRHGITGARVAELYERMTHPPGAAGR